MLGESTKALAKLKQVRQALEAESPTTFNHGDAQKMLIHPKKTRGKDWVVLVMVLYFVDLYKW